MSENMRKFMEAVSSSKELQEKMNRLQEDAEAKMIELARELGIELTEADFVQPVSELTDDELDAVAGGAWCWCSFGGDGQGDENENRCACVMGGTGEWLNGEQRCVCVRTGNGEFDEK